MLFTSLLPWVIVFSIQRDEDGVYSTFEKSISQSIDVDLRDLCVSNNNFILKKVKLLNLNGDHFVKNWLMKFYFYGYKSNASFPRNDTVITVRSNEMKQLNLSLCDSNNRLLLYKLEITHYVKSRPKRSSKISNNLEQSWSSDMFEQKFTDERGLEITVKVPRGHRTNSSSRHHGLKDKEIVDDESAKRVTLMEMVNSSTTTTPSTTEVSTTSYPLSESCQQYKMTLEGVIYWSYDQLDKLNTGQINGTNCLSKIPIR